MQNSLCETYPSARILLKAVKKLEISITRERNGLDDDYVSNFENSALECVRFFSALSKDIVKQENSQNSITELALIALAIGDTRLLEMCSERNPNDTVRLDILEMVNLQIEKLSEDVDKLAKLRGVLSNSL